MIGTTASTTTFVISSPQVELQPASDFIEKPQVDLYHVAYYRDDTSYDDLLKALLQKVSVMQKHLAVIGGR